MYQSLKEYLSMPFCLVFKQYLYGPMALKVRQSSPETGAGPAIALPRYALKRQQQNKDKRPSFSEEEFQNLSLNFTANFTARVGVSKNLWCQGVLSRNYSIKIQQRKN